MPNKNLMQSSMLCSLLPIGIIVSNSDMMVVEANEYIFKYFLKEPEGLNGRRFGNIFSCSNIDGTNDLCGSTAGCQNCPLRNGVTMVLEEGTQLSEVEIQHDFVINGRKTSKWFTVNARRFFKGREPHALVAFTDITKRKALENDLVLLGITDALTGIYNRRYIMHRLESILQNDTETFNTISIGMIDIDDFKRINDQYGHVVGDNVLIQFTRTLQDHIRESDYIGRYGGDDFLAIFINSNTENAKNTLRRIQAAFRSLKIEQINFPLNFSAGIIQIDKDPLKISEINYYIKKADDLLYRAKKEGKNGIIIDEDF